MKNIITLLLFTALLSTGCTDWLDVSPRTEKTKDELLSSQQGFQDALTGIYIQMTKIAGYGAHMTYYMVDCMGSLYDPAASTAEAYLQAHNWGASSAETKINNTFAKLYKAISSANSLLEDIDGEKSSFTSEGEFNWIKGEALALRAMCHFDALRLFGPVPSQAGAERILPYVTTFGRDLTEHNTWSEYCTLLLKDLSDAETLLVNDPVCNHSISSLGNPASSSSTFDLDNTFFAYRFYRFNYYAVKALQARVNLWLGNDSEALAAAKAVITAKNPDGSDKFILGTSSSFSSGDRLFTSEHVMALYDFSLADRYDTYFSNGTLYKGSSYTQYIKNDLYGSSGVDIREPEVGDWWTIAVGLSGTHSYCISDKYKTDDNTNANIGMRIPIFRLAEMYLIATETAPIGEAQTYYDTYLRSRNLGSISITEDNRLAALRKEYLKEFYAEGHMFFVYKRMNSPREDILWAPATLEPNYVLPLPDDEFTYSE